MTRKERFSRAAVAFAACVLLALALSFAPGPLAAVASVALVVAAFALFVYMITLRPWIGGP